tara:strand:+ start:632 stop:775 length:144 start_codon:yes stop_codon:yes gene_type:complete
MMTAPWRVMVEFSTRNLKSSVEGKEKMKIKLSIGGETIIIPKDRIGD